MVLGRGITKGAGIEMSEPFISFESEDELRRWLSKYVRGGLNCNYSHTRLDQNCAVVMDFVYQVLTWKKEGHKP